MEATGCTLPVEPLVLLLGNLKEDYRDWKYVNYGSHLDGKHWKQRASTAKEIVDYNILMNKLTYKTIAKLYNGMSSRQ